MAYQSGEFSVPGLNNLIAPPAVAIYSNTLYVFGGSKADANGRMTQTTLNLQDLVWTGTPPANAEPLDTEALTNGSNWNTGFMSMPDNTPCTYSRSSAASMPDGLYAFWHHFQFGDFSDSSDLRASRNSGAGWGHTIMLLESDGKTSPNPLMSGSRFDGISGFADVSVTGLGDNFIIYTCAQATSATNSQGGIFLAIYDTTKIDPNQNTWTADWHTYLGTEQMQFYDQGVGSSGTIELKFGNTGVNVYTDWFSAVGVNGQLDLYLVISYLPQQPSSPISYNFVGAMIYLPITVTEGADSVIASVSITPPTTLPCIETIDLSALPIFAAPVIRDPAGRIRIYDLENQWAGYYSTAQYPQLFFPGLPLTSQKDQFTTPSGLNIRPSALFYVFTPGASQTPVNGAQGIVQATDYPVYEFVFYNQCQVNCFGTIRVIPNCSILTPKPDTTNVIAGIIDGPIPLPAENYQGYEFGEGHIDSGDITYGTTDTTTNSRQVSNSGTVGIESSGEVTTGVGAAWDYSMNGGMGSVTGSTEQTSFSYNMPQNAFVDEPVGNGPGIVNPFGSLQKVAAQINATAYRFFDQNGNLVTDATTKEAGQAPKLATVLATLTQPSILSYTPYSITPGDLTSYTPQAWNTKMQSLGYTDSENYYGEVICTNAYPFAPGEPYLNFSWSEGDSTVESFTQFNSSFTEQSWTFDMNFYAGVSAGGGFDLFGLGEDAQAKIMGGLTYSHEYTRTENEETDWGISLSANWGPPNVNTAPNPVINYEFRLFFLPVPAAPSTLPANYWTKELKEYMPVGSDTSASSIDPNSSCWRIVFVVTSITYKNDPSLNYL